MILSFKPDIKVQSCGVCKYLETGGLMLQNIYNIVYYNTLKDCITLLQTTIRDKRHY